MVSILLPMRQSSRYLWLPNTPDRRAHAFTNSPPELQDQILSHTSLGPVKVAQLGCALDLGPHSRVGMEED